MAILAFSLRGRVLTRGDLDISLWVEQRRSLEHLPSCGKIISVQDMRLCRPIGKKFVHDMLINLLVTWKGQAVESDLDRKVIQHRKFSSPVPSFPFIATKCSSKDLLTYLPIKDHL